MNKQSKSQHYYLSIRNEGIVIPTEDAERIRYIFEATLAYIDEVGPRDLRDYKDEIVKLITKLPSLD